MQKPQQYAISVLGGTPDWDNLAKETASHLNRILTARKLQYDEDIPYADDLEIFTDPQESNPSTLNSKKISRKSTLIPKLIADSVEKSVFAGFCSKTSRADGCRQVAVVIPQGDLDCKTLVKHFSKLSQMKEKSEILLVFLRGKTPVLDRDHPQNCKKCLTFWSFSKCQVNDEEECVDEVIKHLLSFS